MFSSTILLDSFCLKTVSVLVQFGVNGTRKVWRLKTSFFHAPYNDHPKNSDSESFNCECNQIVFMHGSLAYCTDILVVNIADGQVKISVQEVCKTITPKVTIKV